YLQVVGATAVDLIQTTGSVSLISTGAISDADAGTGDDVLGTGLKIVAVGGIGSAADPIETRVATLNAANTSGGDIAIADTAGTNVVVAGTLIAPSALIEADPAANVDDTFTITPSATTPITVDGGSGTDTLNFNADGLPVTILGNQIIAAGRAPVTFNNVEF